MNQYRIYLASALGIAALIAVAMLWINSARYYPVVRVALPDKSALVFVDTPWGDKKKCLEANQKVIGVLRANCAQCQIDDSCAEQIDPLWEVALEGQAIDNYVVYSGTTRIVISAGDASKQTCTMMAEQITRNKKQMAQCVSPR